MFQKLNLFIVCAAISCILLFSVPAHAVLKLEINKGHFDPLPIALANLSGTDASAAKVGRDIARVVEADLKSSGLFRPIDKRAFIEHPDINFRSPNYANWRQINAAGLVTGKVITTGAGK